MRTRLLIPILAAAMLAPPAAPAAATGWVLDRGGRAHAAHQPHHHLKPTPHFDWHVRPPVPHFAHVSRPHAPRGWHVPPRPTIFAPSPWYGRAAPPVVQRPLPHRPFPGPRAVIVTPWRW